MARKKDGQCGVVNKNGETVIPFNYFEIDYVDGLFIAKNRGYNGAYWLYGAAGVFDIQGKEMLPMAYFDIRVFGKYVWVEKSGRWGIYKISNQPDLRGDANCDGLVDIHDILFVRDCTLGDAELTDNGWDNLLTDDDDPITIDHILLIRDAIFEVEK